MEIVFDIESAFQFIEDEKACASLEKNFSKCLLDFSKKRKTRGKERQKNKKKEKQKPAEIMLLSKELVYQWRLLITVIFKWLFEYGEPPLEDGEGWKALNLIKVSKSEDLENLESEELKSDTMASNTNNPITAIKIRIADTFLYQLIEGRLTTKKVHFVLMAKKTSKGIEFMFKMAKDTGMFIGWEVLEKR